MLSTKKVVRRYIYNQNYFKIREIIYKEKLVSKNKDLDTNNVCI